MDVTPTGPPPFPTSTLTRPRRSRVAEVPAETQLPLDEIMEIMNVAVNDPPRAGQMLHELALRQIFPDRAPPVTPDRNQQPPNVQRYTRSEKRENRRYTPYSSETREPARPAYLGRFPQRPMFSLSPSSLSISASTISTSPSLQQPSLSDAPTGVLSRVNWLPDFEKLHEKPCLRLISSATSLVELSRPYHCVYDERRRNWIVSDKDRGIVFINKDCFLVTRSITDFEEPSAVALLNNGDCLGVLDNNGISIYDKRTGKRRSLFPHHGCRGLAVTPAGDFVTVHPRLRYIFLVPQNGDTPMCYPYEPHALANDEGQPSAASFINVSETKLLVVDYTIGAFNLYKFNPYSRELNLMLKQDCNNGVALCRLTGGFMDAKGRIIVTNCKERICMLFDSNGTFLQQIPCDINSSRTQYICVNNDYQALILDSLRKPHAARLCRVLPDLNVLKDDFPKSKHPTPVYPEQLPKSKHPTPVYPEQHAQTADQPPCHGPSTRYLEPKEIENSLAECKGLMSVIDINDDSDNDIQILE